jgi:hypothetical protein
MPLRYQNRPQVLTRGVKDRVDIALRNEMIVPHRSLSVKLGGQSLLLAARNGHFSDEVTIFFVASQADELHKQGFACPMLPRYAQAGDRSHRLQCIPRGYINATGDPNWAARCDFFRLWSFERQSCPLA